MRGLEIRPFSDADLDDAASLLARRHHRHREAEPLLPGDVDFRAQVDGEWRAAGASGVFATRDGAPVGYLIGRPRPLVDFATWMVVGIGGVALDGDAEFVRDLYAAAAADWVAAGHTRHGVFVPSFDAALVDAWFRLSFGASGALATRETAPEAPIDANVVVRPATPDDLEAAARLDKAMSDSMIPSPSFSGMSSRSEELLRDEWRKDWGDERFEHFVAERDGRVVGNLLLYRRPSDLRVPADSIDLAHASTEPEARGSGVGRALTAHALRWAHAAGIPTMVTDWRMTNLLASRFWPRRGFRTTFLRLYRHIP
jgi:ribosomal protein S18 acetylase RimI-like enzyme